MMWTALTGVSPGASVGSVNANAASPKFCTRSVLTADLSSPTSTARMMLTPAVGLGSVKIAEKIACTDRAAVSVTTHGAVPVQPPPLQPVNDAPGAGLAVSVTLVPLG